MIKVEVLFGVALIASVGFIMWSSGSCECFDSGPRFESQPSCVSNAFVHAQFFLNDDLRDNWANLYRLATAIDIQKRLEESSK